jgi:GT2 family glycosyltransferase
MAEPSPEPDVDLTVVVLSWNTRAHTLRALAAVEAAVVPARARTICVDNASRDGTAAAVREALPHVLVVENPENLGFSRGNDAALPHARGRAVCFLNSDTVASPGSLANALARLDGDPTIGIVGPRLVHPDGTPQRSAWPFPTTAALLHQYTPLGWLGVGARDRARIRGARGAEPREGDVDYVSGACLVVRRSLCERLGGFDPGYPFYFEDVDLAWRAARLGARVVGPLEGPPVVHLGGASAALAGGSMRLPLLAGILRFQRRRLGRRAGRVFAAVFQVGAVARSLGEVARGPALEALRRLRGPRLRADRAAARWRAHARFLERDVVRLLRA